MDFKYKKILLITGFITIVLILGYLLYLVFFKPAQPKLPTGQPVTTTTPSGLPTAQTGPGQVITPSQQPGVLTKEEEIIPTKPSPTAQGRLTETTQLNQSLSLGATLSNNGTDLQYYNRTDQKFYRITKEGQITTMTDKIFYEVDNIVWSPDKNKAILEYPDGANIVYNFSTNQQVTLPTHWKDFDFSPDGNKIVMKSMGIDPSNRWLAITSPDGSKSQNIESLGDKDDTVYPSWSPNNQIIAMFTEGIDFDRQEIFFVGLNNENFKSTIVNGRGFEPKWSPQGDKLLYSVYSSQTNLKPMLWIVNAQGEDIGSGRKNLNVQTWAKKCTFANNTEIYCAVPEKLEEGAGLFPEMAKNTKDNLYKIDLETGIKKLIAIPDGNFVISNIIISQNGYYLYFADDNTSTLHKIKLK